MRYQALLDDRTAHTGPEHRNRHAPGRDPPIAFQSLTYWYLPNRRSNRSPARWSQLAGQPTGRARCHRIVYIPGLTDRREPAFFIEPRTDHHIRERNVKKLLTMLARHPDWPVLALFQCMAIHRHPDV